MLKIRFLSLTSNSCNDSLKKKKNYVQKDEVKFEKNTIHML